MSDNGIAMPILRLGEVSVEKRPIEFIRDGKPVILEGYVYGRRCPGSVKSELAAAQERFVREAPKPPDDAPEDEKLAAGGAAQREYHVYLRECLRILIPDLTFTEADLFSGDDERDGNASKILVYLNWFSKPGEANDENPPAGAASQVTTAGSSRTSSRATASGSENS